MINTTATIKLINGVLYYEFLDNGKRVIIMGGGKKGKLLGRLQKMFVKVFDSTNQPKKKKRKKVATIPIRNGQKTIKTISPGRSLFN